MTTIVALCPYCRRGGVRAPERIIGSVATCPKCGSQFTIVPKEQAEDLTAGPQVETHSHAIAADITEPAKPLPEVAEPSESRDPAFTVALLAFTIFGLGVVATVLPFGRFIGLGLCSLGLILGAVALLGEGLAVKLGAAAVGLNLVAVTLLAVVPTWLGFTPTLDDDAAGRLKGPHSIAIQSNDISTTDRTDAGKALFANADVRIGVRAFVQPLELAGPKGEVKKPREYALNLHVGIMNSGVERRVPLSGWAQGIMTDDVKLTDPAGNVLKAKTLDAGWKPTGFEKMDGVFPGKSAEVILLFDAPASSKSKRIEYLNLDLPGSGVGLVEPIRFTIPGPF